MNPNDNGPTWTQIQIENAISEIQNDEDTPPEDEDGPSPLAILAPLMFQAWENEMNEAQEDEDYDLERERVGTAPRLDERDMP